MTLLTPLIPSHLFLCTFQRTALLINPFVSAQNYEYKVSNQLEKTTGKKLVAMQIYTPGAPNAHILLPLPPNNRISPREHLCTAWCILSVSLHRSAKQRKRAWSSGLVLQGRNDCRRRSNVLSRQHVPCRGESAFPTCSRKSDASCIREGKEKAGEQGPQRMRGSRESPRD